MKFILKYSIITLFASLLFSACDIIDNPIKDGGIRPPEDSTVVLRKVVIEDFTGHICKNCPNAAKKIKELKAAYGDQVIGIAIHAGPSNFTGVTTDYPDDFTTAEGTQIFNFFQIPALPMGMVSRIGYTPTGTGHLKTYSSWPSVTAGLVDDTAKFDIKASTNLTASTGDYTVDIEVEALDNYTNDVNFVVMLLESKIIGPQLMPDNVRNPDYEFDHTLRQTITDALGDPLNVDAIVLGEKYVKQVKGKIDPSWDPQHCEVVVYVMDVTTKEILQAEEIILN